MQWRRIAHHFSGKSTSWQHSARARRSVYPLINNDNNFNKINDNNNNKFYFKFFIVEKTHMNNFKNGIRSQKNHSMQKSKSFFFITLSQIYSKNVVQLLMKLNDNDTIIHLLQQTKLNPSQFSLRLYPVPNRVTTAIAAPAVLGILTSRRKCGTANRKVICGCIQWQNYNNQYGIWLLWDLPYPTHTYIPVPHIE